MSNPREANNPSASERPIRLGAGSLAWPAALAAMILIASGRSMSGAPFLFKHSDKVIHFFVFGLLATLIVRAGPVWRREGSRAWIAIAAVALFGIADEFRQSFTPGRFVEIADWVCDTAGAATAVLFYLRWAAYRRVLEMPLWGRRRDLPSKAESTP